MTPKFLIVGSGFSGCVLARQLAEQLPCEILIVEERTHMGGNSHTARDGQTGIMVHEYGPHIFHTHRREIWDYVNRFGTFRPYVHRVKARVGDQVYPLPINLQTINQFAGASFNPAEAQEWITAQGDASIEQPANFEEQALRMIGPALYQAFFYGYTKKQWGCEPRELPASILKRLPVRFNYDDNYHNSQYTGIPEEGYTAVMANMIDHPSIQLILNQSYQPGTRLDEFDHIFFTGPLDAYYQYCFGRLGYRTVRFDKHYATGDFQGLTQMNYCDETVPYTRITEHKHFTPWEQHDQTIYFTEYSFETGIADAPYYPKRLMADKERLMQYRQRAENETRISFLGRLATYRYMDMHQVIGEAIDFSASFIQSFNGNSRRPVFPNQETGS